jgi:L-asparagine transporter-like permease
VTSGEAKDPTTALPKALRWTLARMGLFYVGGLAVVVGIVPWNEVGLGESPFVRVFETVGIPAAAGVMNFVVLTAALSSVNCNLYLMARMLFSLSRGGYAPASLGRLSKRGTPVAALLVSSAGMFAALFVDHWFHAKAYVYMLGSAFLGGIFVWHNDIRHASCVSPAHRELGKTSPAVCPARGLEFCFWTHGTDRSTYFHVVGPGSADHAHRGSSLACVHFAVLPCVEEGPFSEDFRGSPARWMNC